MWQRMHIIVAEYYALMRLSVVINVWITECGETWRKNVNITKIF